jgi:mRNA interferase RelE/StbE
MNSRKNWALQVDLPVYKFLSRISRKDSERILRAIERLPQDPFFGDIQKLKGEENVWRRRIGSYRFRFEVFNSRDLIRVFIVERRSSKSY